MKKAYSIEHISRMSTPPGESISESAWKPVRHSLGIRAFGVNAFVAQGAGERTIPEHDEVPEPGSAGQRHEELYYVAAGRATFTLAGAAVDAPAGTFVFVRDPATTREAVAREPGTTILAIGAQPGVPYEISPWERKRVEA